MSETRSNGGYPNGDEVPGLIETRHKFVNVDDVGHQNLNELNLQGWDKCEQHGRTIKYFCKDDSQIICSRCAIVGKHRRCHNVEITSVASGVNERLKEIRDNFFILGKETKRVLNQLEEVKNTMFHQVEQLPLTLQNTREHINSRFKSTREKLIDESTGVKNKQISKMNEKEDLCKFIDEESKKSIKILTDVSESGVIENQFIAKKKLEHAHKKISETCKTISEIEAVNIMLEFEDPLNWLEKTGQSPGTLKINLKKKDQEATEYRSLKLAKMMSTLLVKSEEEEDPLYTGLDFFPDKRLVVVDNKNMKIKILDLNLETLNSSDVLTYHPQDIVAISNNEIATTACIKRKIDIFNVNTSNEITLVRTIHSSAQLQNISLGDNNNFIVGLYEDVVPIRCISTVGEEKNFSISFPSNFYDTDMQACLWISNVGKIVMCDPYEHSVFIYDTALNTKVVVKDEEIRRPFRLAHGPFDSFFVCCYILNGPIVQISSTGRILSMHKLGIDYPYSMGVTKDYSRLAVSSSEPNKCTLHMLKLEN